jgi:DNA polymerase-3 subunit alpha
MLRAGPVPEFDIDTIPLGDASTLELLQKGAGIGIFQLEGAPLRALMRSLQPTSFDDVAALVALYRPGPMAANMHNDYADRKNGRQSISYLHADLEEVLGDTYGLMIYQESVMRVAQKIAGYSLAEADNLRKACLPAGAKVLTRTGGYQPIEKVMSLRDRGVQTIDTTSCTSRFEAVADVWPVGCKPVYRLTTSTGYQIEATAEHPFLVESRWTELGEIRVGDLVAVAGRTTTHGGARVGWSQVELAALLISEGYTPDPRTHPAGHFTNTDPELLETFRTAYGEFFGRPHRGCSTNGSITTLRLSRQDLVALASALGTYGTAEAKTIPSQLINAPREKVERFVGLYFCADGWADRSGAHFGSKSEAVCRGLKRMLLRFGITVNLHHRDIAGHGRHWTLSICDKGLAKRFATVVEPHLTTEKYFKVRRWLTEWENTTGASATGIGIPSTFVAAELTRRQAVTGRSRRQLGIDGSGLLRTRILHRRTLDGLLYSERLEDLRSGDLLWDTVASIDPVGDRECFDFRMENDDRPYAVVEDFLVHNCGKKQRDLIAAEREKFVAGCERTGYGRELGTRLFDIIEPFADYAFNKSHAYGYGLVAYQTAYLKAHHPVEYLACLLTSVKSSLEKAAVYIAECRAMGIRVLPPDINRSATDFAALAPDEVPDGVTLPIGSPGAITFGLSAVRNVGEGLVGLLLAERDENGPFASFHEFVERVPEPVLNKRAVESLIKAGAFDSLGHPRKGLLGVFEHVTETTLNRRRERDQGVMSLFGEWGDTPDETGPRFDERLPVPDVEFDKHDKLRFEKEMLGLYVSDHPLFGVEAALRRKVDHAIADVLEFDDGATVHVGGIVTGLTRKFTRRGDQMAVFVLEDLGASIEVTLFPRTLMEHGHKLADDVIVAVKGRLDRRDESRIGLICQTVEVLNGLAAGAPPLRVRIPSTALDELCIQRLKRILRDHPGDSLVIVDLRDLSGSRSLRLPDEFRVDVDRVVGELRIAFGHDSVAL